MAKVPWFSFYPDDFLSSPWVLTADMSDVGAYITLLGYQWKHVGCQLPDDMPYLLRLCKKQLKPTRLKRILEEKFELVEVSPRKRFWRNARLYAEFSKALRKGQVASESASVRWDDEKNKLRERLNTATAKALAVHMPSVCENDATRSRSQNQTEPTTTARRFSIAEQKAESAWSLVLETIRHHITTGNRLAIPDKLSRDTIQQIGGATRLRKEFDQDEYKDTFISKYKEIEVSAYQAKSQ